MMISVTEMYDSIGGGSFEVGPVFIRPEDVKSVGAFGDRSTIRFYDGSKMEVKEAAEVVARRVCDVVKEPQ